MVIGNFGRIWRKHVGPSASKPQLSTSHLAETWDLGFRVWGKSEEVCLTKQTKQLKVVNPKTPET